MQLAVLYSGMARDGWARDETGQFRDFLSPSRLSHVTNMRNSHATICPVPARPADFCPGPKGHKKCPASPGTIAHP